MVCMWLTRRAATLFEGATDGSPGGPSASYGLLPRADADMDDMLALGRIVCKCAHLSLSLYPGRVPYEPSSSETRRTPQ